MTVSITWSESNGGSAVADSLTGGGSGVLHGSADSGENTTEREIYLAHDGENNITDAGFYLAAYSGTYGGDFSASVDLAELISWGDNETESGFGGFQLNMDATGSYASDWSTYNDKSGTLYNVFRTGVADSVTNKITLPVGMGLSSAGVIPSGTSPNVRFKCRILIPTDEATLGIRQFEQRLRYTYTS